MSLHDFVTEGIALISEFQANEYIDSATTPEDIARYEAGEDANIIFTQLGDENEVDVQVSYDFVQKQFHYTISGSDHNGNWVEVNVYVRHETEDDAIYDLECLCFDDLIHVPFDYSFLRNKG